MPIRHVLVALVLTALPAVPLAGRASPAVAQEAGAGLVDDGTYRSPRYGYEVTWEPPYAADPAQTRSGVGASDSDVLTLGEGGGNRAVRIEGFVDESGLDDPLTDRDYVEALIEGVAAALDGTCVPPACVATVVASSPGASPPTLTYDFAIQGRVLRAITSLATTEIGAVRIVFAETLVTFPNDLGTALEAVQASISVAGRPALEGAMPSAEAGTPAASPGASRAAPKVTPVARGGHGPARR